MNVEIEKPIDYMIKCVDGDCTLVSLVDTNYNGIAENFICSGTVEYCREIEKRLRDEGNNRTV
jgi:hypothetical protein